MPSKRSEVSGTASGADLFSRARIRLTLFYLAVLFAVIALLSAVVYLQATQAGSQPGHSRLEGLEGSEAAEAQTESGEDYAEDVLRALLVADAVTLAAAGVLGWVLAGRTLRPIREAARARERFFAQAAHDLRTPLAVMRTEAEVALESGELSGEAARLAASQVEEIGRLSALVDGLLDLVRGRRREAAHEPVLLSRVAESVAKRLCGRAERGGVALAFVSGCPDAVRGDRLEIERAIANVLENAIAYTPAGGTVRIRCFRTGRCVHVLVHDSGIGIGSPDLGRIGEPFFRGEEARSLHATGTGLGVAIVRRIVESHGGLLRISSRRGHGTTVDLRFPAA
jgi:signal transduction histidine kinase